MALSFIQIEFALPVKKVEPRQSCYLIKVPEKIKFALLVGVQFSLRLGIEALVPAGIYSPDTYVLFYICGFGIERRCLVRYTLAPVYQHRYIHPLVCLGHKHELLLDQVSIAYFRLLSNVSIIQFISWEDNTKDGRVSQGSYAEEESDQFSRQGEPQIVLRNTRYDWYLPKTEGDLRDDIKQSSSNKRLTVQQSYFSQLGVGKS